MVEKYKYLLGCFAGFSSEFYEMTWNEYRVFFLEGIRHDRLNEEQIRMDVIKALSDDKFSWKEVAEKKIVFFYAEDKTEEDTFIAFKLLTWDILFPEEILPSETLELLKFKSIEIIKKQLKTMTDKSVHIDDIIWQLENEEKWSNLSRFDLLYMQREIAQEEIELEYFVPELWFFKLRSKAEPTSLEEQIRMSK